MQDWKMTDKSAGLENAGLENDGQMPPPEISLSVIFLSCKFSAPQYCQDAATA